MSQAGRLNQPQFPFRHSAPCEKSRRIFASGAVPGRFAAIMLAGLLLAGPAAAADVTAWPAGTRVIVDKAGTGHRAIVLQTDGARSLVAFEGEEASFDEWVETALLRPVPARVAAPVAAAAKPAGPVILEPVKAPVAEAAPERFAVADSLVLPRPVAGAVTVQAWLEPLPRASAAEPLRFNEARLAQSLFSLPPGGGIASPQSPTSVVFLPRHAASPAGFAAIEGGQAVLYQADATGRLARAGQLDLEVFGSHPLTRLGAGDLNGDGETDLIVLGGPCLQVYFGTADGRYVPSVSPYRGKQLLRFAAPGRFFAGANPRGVAVVEGENSLRLLAVTSAGVAATNDAFTVKFDRITSLVAGDFDGDGFSDLAIATETKGQSTGAWMFFNQNSASQSFLWPVGGKDDFARALYVADLDRDGRDDLIMTDNDVDRGERVRVVFGSAGRGGWEDGWDLIGQELGLGLGTGAVVVGDFNHDGRPDIGVAGRNGLRLYLGADYRRFGRNPAWPVAGGSGNFPDQREFLAADFNGDGVVDLLGFTPAFATGYNLLLNMTPETVPGVFVPPPLHRKAAVQASSTETKIERASESPPGTPELRFLASRAEPYGPYRYRIVVEVAATDDGVVQAVDGLCKYADQGPLREIAAKGVRQGDQQWALEVVLPRGRTYEFTLTAKDDKGVMSLPLRVTVSP
jgi:hypothetical protein